MKSVEFTYTFPKEITRRFHRIYLPEVQLICLVIVATKLLFPFDNVKRYPQALNDPSVQVIDWEKWAEAQSTFDRRGISQGFLTNGAAMQVTKMDAMEMTQQQLDEYMDWYDRFWVADKGKDDLFVVPNARHLLIRFYRCQGFQPFCRDVSNN